MEKAVLAEAILETATLKKAVYRGGVIINGAAPRWPFPLPKMTEVVNVAIWHTHYMA